jgi:hypothetical protein
MPDQRVTSFGAMANFKNTVAVSFIRISSPDAAQILKGDFNFSLKAS